MKCSAQELVDQIIVTTVAGNAFDGDEIAQNRMSRAITAMNETDVTTWVLADNSTASVSRAELQEAVLLAGEEMTRIWITPYQ